MASRSGSYDAKDPLSLPVQYLKGVGPARAKSLARLGISTVRDLLEHFPRRYEDRSHFKAISQLVHGELETLCGVVTGVQETRPRRGLVITRVGVTDGMTVAWGVWFNQPYLARHFPPGTRVILSGRVERRFGQAQITNPEYEVIGGSLPSGDSTTQVGGSAGLDETIHTGRVVPIYPLTEGLQPRAMRAIMKNVVDQYAGLVPDPLPFGVRSRHGLAEGRRAWAGVHFPSSLEALEEARRRLVFDELFVLQLGLAMIKSTYTTEAEGIPHRADGPLLETFLRGLPFTLTQAQQRAYGQIRADMESPRPMNRLIQGDVGSGKTVVAAIALLKAVESGYQGALMAPTEILAVQHYLNLSRLLAPLDVRVELVTGSLAKKDRETVLGRVASGEARIVVGTHALIQEGVEFARLSLVVTDEQHRFGVRQRARLQEKGGLEQAADPDVLVMTATPIPRTLALTLYGDLDFSVIDELPPGRKPVRTYWRSSQARKKVYDFVRGEVGAGRQAYVVCPLVDESEKMQAEAATAMAEKLGREVFPDLRVGLLHGRMKTEEKDAAMGAFRSGETQILVATTVIEVGVDVPNASVILIEGADRFGLAQLHQLRGRVGRGRHQSYCILMADPKNDEARERMLIMQSTADGFKIAEEDLRLRGPGQFFGTRQHGLPDLKIANPLKDMKILEIAREEAFRLIAEDNRLSAPELAEARKQVVERFRENLGMIRVS